MNRLFIFIILISVYSFKSAAQTEFRLEPELGISITDIEQQKHDLYWTGVSLKTVISPLIGITGGVSIKKYFLFSSGIQYDKIGFCFPGTPSYPAEKIIYHKLCIPLTANISIGSSKINPGIFIGYRPNILITGSWEKFGTVKNPFDLEYPPNRFTSQFIFGVSVTFLRNYAVSFSYSKGKAIDCYYIRTLIYPWGGPIVGPVFISVQNNEYSLSLKYYFKFGKSSEKKDQDNNQ